MNTLTNLELKASLRIIDRAGEPWFVAKDVCQALGIEKTDSALRRLDEDEKDAHSMSTLGGSQKMAIVSESGLYALILRSDKPNARVFRRWVTSEVLPQIRRTGGFSGGWENELAKLERDSAAARALLDEAELKLDDFRERMRQRLGEKPLALPAPRVGQPRLDYEVEAAAMPLPCHWHEAVAWAVQRWAVPRIKTVEMRILRMEQRGILARDKSHRLIRAEEISPNQ